MGSKKGVGNRSRLLVHDPFPLFKLMSRWPQTERPGGHRFAELRVPRFGRIGTYPFPRVGGSPLVLLLQPSVVISLFAQCGQLLTILLNAFACSCCKVHHQGAIGFIDGRLGLLQAILLFLQIIIDIAGSDPQNMTTLLLFGGVSHRLTVKVA
jgi:hypothetical protein